MILKKFLKEILALQQELNNTLTDFSNAFETGTPSQSEITDKVTNITDIIAEVVNSRIDEEQLNNDTVKALVINDLLGETLEHYGIALGNTEGEHESEHDENMTSSSPRQIIRIMNLQI